MKKCPVCNARTFEDMETCFGCMHRFKDEKDNPSVEEGSMPLEQGFAVPLFCNTTYAQAQQAMQTQEMVLPGNSERPELTLRLQLVLAEPQNGSLDGVLVGVDDLGEAQGNAVQIS